MVNPTWKKSHGKLWLAFSFEGTCYEIPVNPDSRFVDGLVLFWDEGTLPLVKGMMTWDPGMSELLSGKELLPVNQELERFQAPIILAQGGSLDWTTPEEAYAGEPVAG